MMSVYGRNASGCSSHDSTDWQLLAVVPIARFGVSYFCNVLAFHIGVELFEQIARVLRPVVSKMLFVQEEVDAQVCFADYGGVLDGEVAYAGEYQVFECLNTDDTRP
jgi:hypothetical protein